tara:strand:+ start:523 stop:627 length:105 start_codon:yes stop_codon:yes gene_type:complete
MIESGEIAPGRGKLAESILKLFWLILLPIVHPVF